MTESLLAFRATYSDWKLVKTRGVVQVVMEVPLADADTAYQILGGMPEYSQERWFGIAPIRLEANLLPAKCNVTPLKKDWRALSPQQQAGIRCSQPSFIAFLKEERPDDWHEASDPAECVRMICGVESRSMLGTVHAARVIWKQLDDQFQAWLAKEHA